MTIESGTRLGSYVIESPLGAGGMGEVYRAKDTGLNRTVAVKVLPRETAGDASAAARFEREAKAVAALNHPNILSIFDFDTDDGQAYAVMELLDGDTLRERLGNGALPTRKAVEYAAAIARGLAAAHDKGIIHRDLKPENVIITRDEQVKILDFGLAKQTLAGDGQTMSLEESATRPGAVLGTVGYMSPEQVRGQQADSRSDIFSLGAILYEMLSGERAFQGDSAVETMSAILKHDPPELSRANADLPAGLERVVRHCLEKQPEARFQSASDLAFDLESGSWASGSSQQALDYPRERIGGPNRWLVVAGCLAVAAAAFVGGQRMQTDQLIPEPIKVRPLTFSGSDSQPTVSPDGRFTAFASRRDGVSRIWLKQFAGGGEQPLTGGTDELPRFSADGSSVFYIHQQGGRLHGYRTSLVGGQPRKVIDNINEIAPSPDGRRIAFTRISLRVETEVILGIATVDGDEEQTLLQLENMYLSGIDWSPDGSKIAVTRWPPQGAATGYGLIIVDVESGASREVPALMTALSGPIWSSKGDSLIYAEAPNTVGNLTGAPARVVMRNLADDTVRTLFWAQGLFPFRGFRGNATMLSRAGPGRIAFDSFNQRMTLFETTSDGPRQSLTRGSGADRQPAYSPDGRRLAFTSNRSGNMDIWALDRATGKLTQLTDDPGQDWDPGFTPDGRHLLFSSDRSGNMEIWIANADGTDARQLTRDGIDAENATMTADGEWVVYAAGGPDTVGIWRIRPDGSEAERLIVGERTNPEVSPDGRYALFVRPFGDSGIGQIGAVNVVDIRSGELVDFSIQIERSSLAANITYGRGRWMPDGSAIAFVGIDAEERTGIYLQDFEPGVDTSHTRRKLAGFFDDLTTESFGISPDGSRLALAVIDATDSVMLAEGVPD